MGTGPGWPRATGSQAILSTWSLSPECILRSTPARNAGLLVQCDQWAKPPDWDQKARKRLLSLRSPRSGGDAPTIHQCGLLTWTTGCRTPLPNPHRGMGALTHGLDLAGATHCCV